MVHEGSRAGQQRCAEQPRHLLRGWQGCGEIGGAGHAELCSCSEARSSVCTVVTWILVSEAAQVRFGSGLSASRRRTGGQGSILPSCPSLSPWTARGEERFHSIHV